MLSLVKTLFLSCIIFVWCVRVRKWHKWLYIVAALADEPLGAKPFVKSEEKDFLRTSSVHPNAEHGVTREAVVRAAMPFFLSFAS
jgi:hypothetical protein